MINFQQLLQNNQVVIQRHDKEAHPKGSGYSIRGTNKKEKLEGIYCRTCKKFIGVIKFRSSKKRRR